MCMFRFTWFCIVLISAIVGLNLVIFSWKSYETNDIIIAAESIYYPIWNFQFPAVTICDLNKVSLKHTNQFIRNLNLPANTNVTYIYSLLSYLVQISFLNYDSVDTKSYVELTNFFSKYNLTAYDVMNQIKPKCTDLLQRCSFKNRTWRCDSLFEEIFSVEGYCCSSNYYALRDRKFSGYLSDRYKTKPRRVSASGYESGYRILIKNDPQDYLVSGLLAYGTKILLHDPYEYPDWESSNDVVPVLSYNFISISPIYLYATDTIKSMPLTKKNCYYGPEFSLKYFSNYTYINCMNECRADFIKTICGCLPFIYWDLKDFFKTNTQLCDVKDASCILQYKALFSISKPRSINEAYKKILNNSNFPNKCHCKATCESIEYQIETSRTTFSRRHAVNEVEFYGTKNLVNYSAVNIYFKDLRGYLYKRDVNISWHTGLAWYGGLLSLFIGCSFTTVFEIIYYLTIKPVIDYLFYNRKPKVVNKAKRINVVHPLKEIKWKKSIYDVENDYSRMVPDMGQLYNLKRCNNQWYMD